MPRASGAKSDALESKVAEHPAGASEKVSRTKSPSNASSSASDHGNSSLKTVSVKNTHAFPYATFSARLSFSVSTFNSFSSSFGTLSP